MRIRLLTLIASLAALAAFAFGAPGTLAQSSNLIATPERAATLTIAPPRSPADIFLDLYLKAYVPPRKGMVEAVVSVGPADGEAVEIGRFTFFPAEPFNVTEPREQRAHRFDASPALRRLKPSDTAVTLRVSLVPLDAKISAQGAELTLSKAEFSPRP
jgi:hypothetical protein